MVRFKNVSSANGSTINVLIKNKEVFTAAKISEFTSDYEILNPDHVICSLNKNVNFNIELTVEKGRGYVPADENKPIEQVIGYIPIDAIFTPIKNVKYSVENTRVEQKTDYEKLIIDLETDGSIHPKEALKGAANILIQHFMLFSDQTISLEEASPDEEESVDEETLHMRKLLKTPLTDLGLSVRAFNCLKSAEVEVLGDLVKLDISSMMKFRNFGRKSLAELEQLVADKSLTFGMDMSKYKLKGE